MDSCSSKSQTLTEKHMRNGKDKQPVQSGQSAKIVRCAIYTRKSTDEGLNQNFNSLDAQREAAEAFILSQRGLHTRWSSEYLLRENVLGSLEPKKHADFVDLNRDYLTGC